MKNKNSLPIYIIIAVVVVLFIIFQVSGNKKQNNQSTSNTNQTSSTADMTTSSSEKYELPNLTENENGDYETTAADIVSVFSHYDEIKSSGIKNPFDGNYLVFSAEVTNVNQISEYHSEITLDAGNGWHFVLSEIGDTWPDSLNTNQTYKFRAKTIVDMPRSELAKKTVVFDYPTLVE